jgi:streptomycin 6-kinase
VGRDTIARMEITAPDPVRAKARLAGAEKWLAGLPTLVAELEREWSITAGRPYADATEAYVAEAILADGTPAALKLLVPRAGNAAAHEITVLRLARGAGCVRLLRDDADRGALLLERLGPALVDAGLPIGRRLEILSDLARAVWRPAPGAALPTGAEKGRWLIDYITRLAGPSAVTRTAGPSVITRPGGPCAERTIAHAVACAERRIAAHDDKRAVLVHGDVHQWNTLRAGDGWKLVDPDGLLAEPEYDLGVLMREDPVELMAGDAWDRAHWLAARTGTDATAIWEWGVVERVSTGLLLESLGMPVGADMLAAADELSRRAA